MDEVPRIEGVHDASREPEEREKEQVVLEQASQMDMNQPKQPVDETPFNRDIAKGETQEQVVDSAGTNVKEYITKSWESSLPKARKALAEKRAAAKLQKQQAARGTPAPDLLVDVAKKMEEKFEVVLRELNDMKTMKAHEAPLQQNEIVEQTPIKLVEMPAQPGEIVPVAVKDEPASMPIHTTTEHKETTEAVSASSPSPSRGFKRMYIPDAERMQNNRPKRFKEQERYVRQFSKAARQLDFNNLESMKRAETDPQSQGMPARTAPKSIMW